jgi:hypothetical protein
MCVPTMADNDFELDFPPWIAGSLPREHATTAPIAAASYAPAMDDGGRILIENFLNATPFDMARLFDAIQDGNALQVCEIASRLADASSAVGAAELADFLTDLVSLAAADDVSALSASQQTLGAVCSQVYDRLEKSL